GCSLGLFVELLERFSYFGFLILLVGGCIFFAVMAVIFVGQPLWTYSDNNTIVGNNCSNNGGGICLYNFCNRNTIKNNTCSNNGGGIHFESSSNNNILANNVINSNSNYGIYPAYFSNNNIFYLNDFIDNSDNVYSYDSTNIWNSTSKITYTYNGKSHTNYLGNYWDDYTDTDADNDGIWDNPRPINSDQDYHPLVESFENYITPTEKKMVRPVEGWLVQRFDFDEDVGYKGHEGIDIDSGIDGKEVVAAADGVVVRVHRSITSGAGLWVWIWHDEVTALNGKVEKNISTRYLHLKDIPEEIQPGTKVGGGKTVIGKVSNTGDGLWKWRFPPHLHFEVRQGGNPEDIMSGKITYKDTKALNPLRFVEYEDRSKKAKSLIISAHCPVNLIVEDPDGLVVTKNISEIPSASYFEIPLDEEGNPGYEFVAIDNRKQGTYSIKVTPEPDANLTDAYTLVVSTEYTTTVLAENVSVSEIPTEPYAFESIIYFDTGSPANQYPSIMGTHNGTIKPAYNITVNKMFTYPCSGTGGDTEYARIWNSTLDTNATWNGYVGDWHNISFNKTFTLVANKTYNYTIITGSYPQIHHNRTLIVPDGEIICTEFIDANGKKYNDWIPAIRME
ncbi:MAG: NosD domain-containing protein, partial [Halobacteriota archaeon]